MTVAPAKLNLALVVGARGSGGKHQVVTVLDRLTLSDTVVVERAPADRAVRVEGFAGDTIVRAALEALRITVDEPSSFTATIEKRIPVAAGLGGGSADAASALEQAHRLLGDPLPTAELHRIAAALGADVPFFLTRGPQLGTDDGTELAPLDLPRSYHVVLWLPDGAAKQSTRAVYAAFDARAGATGFAQRRAQLLEALAGIGEPEDIASLPLNDLASSPHADELVRLGAFRADVTGAGPTVYGLFAAEKDARRAADELEERGRVWLTKPLDDA